MASVSNKDIPKEYALCGEWWGLVKKYFIPDGTEAYWKAVTDDCRAMYDKYEQSPFAGYLLHGLLDYLQAKENEIKQRGDCKA